MSPQKVLSESASASAKTIHLNNWICLLVRRQKNLLPYSSKYICEAGFSALAMVESKRRNQLLPQDDFKCALTTIKPYSDELVQQVQGQGSR